MWISPVSRLTILVVAADEGAHRQDGALLDDDALDDLATRADEAIVLDDDGSACSGSRTPPIPTRPDRWQFLPIWAQEGADRRPGVDHCAAVDIGADIDEARHQDDVRRDIRPSVRTIAPGTARKPASRSGSTTSRQISTAPCPTIWRRRARDRPGRPDLDHIVEAERPTAPPFSATDEPASRFRSSRRRAKVPLSIPSSAASTASRHSPLVAGETWSRPPRRHRLSRRDRIASWVCPGWGWSGARTISETPGRCQTEPDNTRRRSRARRDGVLGPCSA